MKASSRIDSTNPDYVRGGGNIKVLISKYYECQIEYKHLVTVLTKI